MTHSSREHFVEYLKASHSGLLNVFITAFLAAEGELARDSSAVAIVRNSAGQMLDDAIESVRAGEFRIDQQYKLLASKIGAARAAEGIHPQESMRAASLWFQTVVSGTRPYLETHPEAIGLFGLLVLGLEHSITTRIRESAAAYTGYLLERVHETQVKERQRIARELHDNIGYGLSVAHRQLELYSLLRTVETERAEEIFENAVEVVRNTMHGLREVTSDLHFQGSQKSLEKALLGYLDTIDESAGITVDLRVSGDEVWPPAPVGEETFIIVREAVRNAITHSQCTQVIIRVNIAPRELRATVEDNGRGFVPADIPPSASMGLASMRERAEIVNGRTTIFSQRGIGTLVELFIPF